MSRLRVAWLAAATGVAALVVALASISAQERARSLSRRPEVPSARPCSRTANRRITSPSWTRAGAITPVSPHIYGSRCYHGDQRPVSLGVYDRSGPVFS